MNSSEIQAIVRTKMQTIKPTIQNILLSKKISQQVSQISTDSLVRNKEGPSFHLKILHIHMIMEKYKKDIIDLTQKQRQIKI